MTLRLAAFTVVFALAASTASAQTRPAFFDAPSTFERVGPVVPGHTLPLLVILPPTNGTAAEHFERLRGVLPLTEYAVMLTPGRPQSSDYLPHFGSYLDWLRDRVMADLETAKQTLPIDPERIYVLGFSLGGDCAWALLIRNPTVFRGALVLGARSSASPRADALRTLLGRHAVVIFAIGDSDDPARRQGIARAHARIEAASIPTELIPFPGAHQVPEPDVLSRALTLLFR